MLHPWLKHGAALLIGALGTTGVVALVLAMNGTPPRPPDDAGRAAVAFEVEAPKPKPPPARRQQRPRQQRPQRAQPPAPVVGASLAGMAFGLDALEGALGDDMQTLLGDINNVVMTADTVDELPTAIQQVSPQVPPRARERGIEGSVIVSLLIDVDGRVQDITLVESRPPGIFDEAVTVAVQQWTFSPATYQGVPVPLRIDYPFRFQFN